LPILDEIDRADEIPLLHLDAVVAKDGVSHGDVDDRGSTRPTVFPRTGLPFMMFIGWGMRQ
jgi:hypothetical protein